MDKIAEFVQKFSEDIKSLDVREETKEMMIVEYFRSLITICEKFGSIPGSKKGE